MNIKKFRQFSIIVLVFGFLTLTFSFYSTQKSQNISQDIKVTYKQQTIFKDGTAPQQLISNIVRLRKADGSWKEIITDFDENGSPKGTRVQYAINGRGLFKISEKQKKLFLVADRPGPPAAFSADSMKKQPNFIKEDSLVGYKTIILRDGSDEINYTEKHYAPDLNGLLLKWIDANAEYTNLLEAVEVKIETITPEDFGELPDYPIDNSYYQKMD